MRNYVCKLNRKKKREYYKNKIEVSTEVELLIRTIQNEKTSGIDNLDGKLLKIAAKHN